MLSFLADYPLVALVLVLACGYAVGRVKIAGISLGAAAILFVAIGVSALNPEITFPPLLYQFGLALFVYSIGLSAGREFFATFPTRGWKSNVVVAGVLIVLTGLAGFIIRFFHFDATTAAGTFAGSLTTTPGMAAIVEVLKNGHPELASTPVVGYSLAYPGGVLGAIMVAAIGAKLLHVDHIQDARDEGIIQSHLEWRVVEVTEQALAQLLTAETTDVIASTSPATRELPHATLQQIPELTKANIVVTRFIASAPGATEQLAHPEAPVTPGMRMVINGTLPELEKATAALGQRVRMELETNDLTYGRVIVSNPALAGRTIKDINPLHHGFLIARIRRGDREYVATGSTILELSDSLRVIAPKQNFPKLRKFLGDSETSLANVNLLPYMIGLSLGLLAGTIPIPLPGGTHLSLGFGGGPIIAGLVLGAMGHTGKIQWQMPFHANRVLTGLGLALFLAGVGTVAGPGFRHAIGDPSSLTYIVFGFGITLLSAVSCGFLGVLVLKMKWDEAMGMAAAVSTNPAVLSYLEEQSRTDLANRGYTTVYPLTMIGKIILCQVLILVVL
ncbi:aspartate:alanine exchanger family transporter [Corynebacterium sp. HMSC28B08]|uniref:aspartate:alanine exchanger family transporter n=1 Tax=Corynebacterium sp. HMSC28B08 TaxID=1581066 RepID=UPI0008A42E39|nr:aspartate:alanine exchanger family transporter [Corynebacterium sp. HMSC28B08]OFT88449.1 transporter [Corynebacterium sp. HMSC28B08]